MGIITDRNTRTGKWVLFLVVLAVLAGCQSGPNIEESRREAEQGDARAQYNLGILYYYGQGSLKDYVGRGRFQDYREAVKWFRKAAEQGNASAQFYLGASYNLGRGVPKDYAEAVRWYRLAAEQGFSSAQLLLGNAYSSGRGVPKDYVEAYAWYTVAVAQGHRASRDIRDSSLTWMMTAEQVAKGQRLAAELQERIESLKPK